MTRIKAGPPRRSGRPAPPGRGLGAAVARTIPSGTSPRLRRALSLGLPTLWGATAVTYKLTCPLAQQTGLGARLLSSAVFLAVGTGLVFHVRRALLRELRQAREAAGAARSVLLRPLPPRIEGLRVAAAQLSADRGALVGGDLYEVIATEHGVRVVMGDVRGHGLPAVATAAAVLGSFREAVHDEDRLDRVLRRLERALERHLRQRARGEAAPVGTDPHDPVAEEFVTVLLLEIGEDGRVSALNRGHPWPYLLRSRAGADGALHRVERLVGGEPLPPAACGRLPPGDGLLLHTDGAEDARDRHGRFFPLPAALTEALRAQPHSPQSVLRTVFTGLLRHTGGAPADDVALLVLHNDRPHAPGPREPAPHDPAVAHRAL
ncbi:PP2C family protein-serine/threonine phosphatase [Streptomyces sp. NPDC008313]|uniref:PP2C family protein-serine/threonine phosphatase n=1 Tax=Streptomyces sp. NPDC008313 TaxID=3364826 RepID=UPI0036E399C2